MSVTPEQVCTAEFMLALLAGRTPPGVEPGSEDDLTFRAIAADAIAVAEAAPPMSPRIKTVVAGLLQDPDWA